MTNLRTIIRDERFEQELALIEPDIKKADEFLQAVEWALARSPFSGQQILKTPTWICLMKPITGNVSHLAVYYAFNDDCVVLMSIKAFKEEV